MSFDRILAIVASVVALVSGFLAYHSSFEEKGATDKGLGAVFLFLKSQNQNAQNFYQDNLSDGVNVETSEKRLESLKYEEKYIDMTQHQLGIGPKSQDQE